MRIEYHKLVRDLIPQIIEADGRQPATRILDEQDYRDALLAKLLEEAAEARDASAEQLPAELADVIEVITALIPTVGMTWDDLLNLTERKREERGGFAKRIYLEHVDQAV